MKLIIQIPCYNEERSLPVTLGNLPREVEGIDEVEWLVIDDGSSDETAEVARSHGAHVVAHTHNKGLARAFMTGLEESLRRGADIIVNTDADNQYDAACIPALIRPILEGKAEIVVGARPIELIEHFSFAKKMLQKLGSFVVRMASGTDIPDAPSGFRAISREAALRTNVFNDYTYTLETIIQAGQKNMAISSVPVRVNEDLRPSRLVKSIPSYIFRSLITITRIFVIYRPFYFCFIIGMCFFIPGFLLGLRFLYYLITENSSGHVQSLIFSSILIVVGFQTFILAFIADSISVNRKISEELQYIKRKNHLG
jgi:glycosyltransferase involved in cell wall biosynthesis